MVERGDYARNPRYDVRFYFNLPPHPSNYPREMAKDGIPPDRPRRNIISPYRKKDVRYLAP